jgi:hypothetical protein
LRKLINKILKLIRPVNPRDWEDTNLILSAQSIMLSESWRKNPDFFNPFWVQKKEFRVYSQFGDDGIIQWLIHALNIHQGRFIEFGVGDYYEINTHFLLINNRFAGFVIDGSRENIDTIRQSSIYWRYKLNAVQHFVIKDNINDLLVESRFKKIELLHIDLDGNDYWILQSLDLSNLDPDILVLEYNSTFGKDRAITIPYEPHFYRMNAHYSGKYFGASLLALNSLAENKGYYFIGCNSAGNNAYFLANRFLSKIPKADIHDGFQDAGYRESRDKQGKLTYSDTDLELTQMRGMPVVDITTNKVAKL